MLNFIEEKITKPRFPNDLFTFAFLTILFILSFNQPSTSSIAVTNLDMA